MNGLGVYDFICKEQYDPVTGETYEALCACNDDIMAERCKVKTAKKVVWCIKASADFNSNGATALRAGIINGNVRFLVDEFEAQNVIKKATGYSKMTEQEKSKLMLPYAQTTLLINEMINLEHEIVNNKVKIKEKSNMRKDRYSSVQYNYYVTQLLSTKLKPQKKNENILNDFVIRPAKKIKY